MTSYEVSQGARLESVACIECASEYAPGTSGGCRRCGFPLAVKYPGSAGQKREAERGRGMWRYHRRLPSLQENSRVTLGEGTTPLLSMPRVGRWAGIDNIFVKNEGMNPTGSFKDRPTALGVSLALELGFQRVAVSSTGNAAKSLAAYGSRAGIPTVAFISEAVPLERVAPLMGTAINLVRVKGGVSDAFLFLRHIADYEGWMNLTSTFVNPYTVEANKTVAYEILEDLGDPPDVVLVPVSVGPLLVGLYRGFSELLEAGQVQRIPRLVAVQASACCPIAGAFERGLSEVVAWSDPQATVASGIADPLLNYEHDGTYTLRTLRATNGFAIACSDEEILQATEVLADCEGLQAEPTGAASIAGVKKAVEKGLIGPGETAVALVTARASSPAKAEPRNTRGFRAIDRTPAALEEALKAGGD